MQKLQTHTITFDLNARLRTQLYIKSSLISINAMANPQHTTQISQFCTTK